MGTTVSAPSARGRGAMVRLAVITAAFAAIMLASGPCETHAADTGKKIEISAKKPISYQIPIGKSESIRTDHSFVDITVGDADIADVIPLSDRALSIHAKKIGMTRVSVFGEGKTLVGSFDVEVSYDTTELAGELARRVPNARLKVASVNGRIMLSGTAPDGIALDRAVTIARQFGGLDVINAARVTQSQQVMLEVRFVEASRTAGRELGFNWNISGNNAAASIGIPGLLGTQAPFGSVIGTLLGSGIRADVLIKSLEERGLARRLAEPNLVALSGDTASFLAGGEFPFPVQSNLGQITVEFKKFGVGLAFTPTVLDSGLINLKIEPEVSQLDPVNVVQVGGVRVPSLIVRRANTTVELRDGQSFAIAGLLQTISNADQQQLPWIADVPILGALFRSASYQKQETDLAIIVTPRLVRPTRPGDTVRTPLDGTVAASDPDFFLLGRGEVTPRQRKGPNADAVAATGHILTISQRAPRAEAR